MENTFGYSHLLKKSPIILPKSHRICLFFSATNEFFLSLFMSLNMTLNFHHFVKLSLINSTHAQADAFFIFQLSHIFSE